MSKYGALIKILDRIRSEGVTAGFPSYGAEAKDTDWTNQTRSRAYIHLYLKVKFGLLNFKERETHVTDGTHDGGIDGYFIDRESKSIYFLQSKFRATEKNFESKQITLDEVAAMDIARITNGEEHSESGLPYNGKIKGLIRNIADTEDIGRYKYKVIIIANLRDASATVLKNLTGGFPVEIFDADRCYSDLVFPVLSGTYFQKEEMSIYLDVSNKSAGAKINYEVSTSNGGCGITVLFVPTLEIAKLMHKYKNSILKHNPRSYLEFDGATVNNSIRATITSNSSNEFALLNNGITMISNETSFNERIAQKNRAQLCVTNPQIINGGQTAYTLSRIYEENISNADEIFAGKEVLLKVITLAQSDKAASFDADNARLIDRISTATNQQTAVTNSDRYSSDDGFEVLQRAIFDRCGVLFERKRGEFGDGTREGYLEPRQAIDRNIFAKIYLAANGHVTEASSRRAFLKIKDPEKIVENLQEIDRFHLGYLYYASLNSPPMNNKNRITVGSIFAFTISHFVQGKRPPEVLSAETLQEFYRKWDKFIDLWSTGEFRQNKISLESDSYKSTIINYFVKIDGAWKSVV